MPLPAGITTITVTGTYTNPDGSAASGTVTFTPTVAVTDAAGKVIIPAATIGAQLNGAGSFSTVLACTDNTALSPSGWQWSITVSVNGIRGPQSVFTVNLPSTLGASVDISALSPVAGVNPGPVSLLNSNNTWTGTNTFQGTTTLPLAPAGIVQFGQAGGPTAANGTVAGQAYQDLYGVMWTWNGSAWVMSTVPGAVTVNLEGPTNLATAEVNAVAARTLQQLDNWLEWLNANNTSGIITEMLIPAAGTGTGFTLTTADVLRWSEVAEQVFRVLDDYSLPVIEWYEPAAAGGPSGACFGNTGEVTYTGTTLPGGTPFLDDPGMPLMRHTRAAAKGFQSGGVVGVSPPVGFSNSNPYSASNWTVIPEAYAAMYAAGARIVRISTRWETIQQTLNGVLDPVEVARLTTAINAAGAAGLGVVLDLHNYCSYVTAAGTLHLGDGTLSQANLVDVWTKLSTQFKSNTNIYAYEIMNEPSQLPATPLATVTSGTGTLTPGAVITVASTAAFPVGRPFGMTLAVSGGGTGYFSAQVASPTTLTVTAVGIGLSATWANGAALDSPQLAWETASQAVVTAIRGNADTHRIAVSGYYYQKAAVWPFNHPVAWITDPNSLTVYAAHSYWSTNATGDSNYEPWATELAACSFPGPGGYAPLPAQHPFMGSGGGRMPMQSGEATMDSFCAGNTTGLTTQFTQLSMALAGKTEPVNFIQVWTGTTPSSVAPSVAQMCIAQVNPDRSITIVAATANDTTMFQIANTGYKRQVSAGMNGPVTVSAATISVSTVTVTVSSAAGFAAGQNIYVSGITGFTNNPNGAQVVTAVNYTSNTISYVPSVTPTGSYVSGGTVGIPWQKQAGTYYAAGIYITQATGTISDFYGTAFAVNSSAGWPLRAVRNFSSTFPGCPGFIAASHWVTTANAFYAELTPT